MFPFDDVIMDGINIDNIQIWLNIKVGYIQISLNNLPQILK